MPSGDSRKDFLLSTVGYFFSQDLSDLPGELYQSGELNNFLDDQKCFILCAYMQAGRDTLILSNKIDSLDQKRPTLVFFKLQPEVITPDNLKSNIFVSSILNSPVSTLYHSVQKVFAPLLLQGSGQKTLNPQLQNLLGELEAGLASIIRQDKKILREENSTNGIVTPLDEITFWKDIAATCKDRERKERSLFFYNSFKPLEEKFTTLSALDFGECKDLLETCYSVLDDIWKEDQYSSPYPQTRMAHLMNIIGSSMVQYIQENCADCDVWTQPLSEVEDLLYQSYDICDTWQDICQKLTSLFWPNLGSHVWQGPPFIPLYLVKFAERLQEILLLRKVHHQLLKLLSPSEQIDMDMGNAFKYFKTINALQYNPFTDVAWKVAVSQFEHGLTNAEQAVAGKLRNQLKNTQGNPLQVSNPEINFQHSACITQHLPELISNFNSVAVKSPFSINLNFISL